jgi:hypothetical protein
MANRTDPARHKEQMRAAGRARYKADVELRWLHVEEWSMLYAKHAWHEGVEPSKVQAWQRTRLGEPDSLVAVKEDLTGRVFDRWTVIERGPDRPRTARRGPVARWWCTCECGTKKLVLGANLRSGGSKSCGCLIIDKLKERHAAKTETGLQRAQQVRGERAAERIRQAAARWEAEHGDDEAGAGDP